VTGVKQNFFATSGVALNAESLENKEPVPSDDNILFLKEFKNPSPVVKIAQLTSAASAFVAAADAIFKIDLRDSITRKLLYRLGKFFKGKLTRINNLIDYLDPGKKHIHVELFNIHGKKYRPKLLFPNNRQV